MKHKNNGHFSPQSVSFSAAHNVRYNFEIYHYPRSASQLVELFLYFILFSHRERFDFSTDKHTASCFTLIFNSLGYFSLDYWARWAANARRVHRSPPLITKNTPDDDFPRRAGRRTPQLGSLAALSQPIQTVSHIIRFLCAFKI